MFPGGNYAPRSAMVLRRKTSNIELSIKLAQPDLFWEKARHDRWEGCENSYNILYKYILQDSIYLVVEVLD